MDISNNLLDGLSHLVKLLEVTNIHTPSTATPITKVTIFKKKVELNLTFI